MKSQFTQTALRLFGVFLTIVAHTYVACAQDAAYFEMPVYFEDARGNRDTIVFGADPQADSENPDRFDGQILTTPFDSVLEVRVMSNLGYKGPHIEDLTLRKRAIGIARSFDFQRECHLGKDGVAMVVHARYPPVTVSWDSTIFSTSYCHIASNIAAHFQSRYPAGPNPWWRDFPDMADITQCMSASSSWVIYRPPGPWSPLNEIFPSSIQPIVGGGIDTLPVIRIEMYPQISFNSPCGGMVSNLDSSVSNEETDLLVYPNPANDHIYFSASPVSYQIFDMIGRIKGSGFSISADISMLPRGMYQLHVRGGRSQVFVVK